MLKKLLAGISAAAVMTSGMVISVGAESTQPADTGSTVYEYDIVVYGGNASGAIAAIQAAKMGKTVAVIEPTAYRIGGMTTGGLGDTDVGSGGVIGGLAKEFYQRIDKKYGRNVNYKFEAKIALMVLEEWLDEYKIPVFLGERLDLSRGVVKDGTAITSITMESGKTFKAKMFLDCTYEGDLMAKADVTYTIGRESNSVYGETLNGITSANNSHNGVPIGIDPYVVPGDPSSGLLPGVNPEAGGEKGDGDDKVQAYNFRWNLTTDPGKRVAAEKPENYDEANYELLFRAIEKGQTLDKIFKTTRTIANTTIKPDGTIDFTNGGVKVDSNNNSGISTDFVGQNYDYPEGDYATREKIIKAHEDYQKGLLWALQNSERVPEAMRKEASKWGLCNDEFTENNYWPTQIYVREARRMVSEFVMTEHVCKTNSTVYVSDSVGMGSYSMDSHHIQYIVQNGQVRAEGDFYSATSPYSISYRSIVPKANECTNLLVPVCLSASHAAYGSIRMEPVFMVLGQSAATAAAIAIDDGVTAQSVNYSKLAERLNSDGQVLYTGSSGGDLPPVVDVDAIVYPIEELATTTGPDTLEYGYYDTSKALSPSTKYNRVLSAKVGDYIEFEVDVEKAGTYSVSTQTYLQDGRAKFRLYLPDEDRYLGGEADQYGVFTIDDAARVKTETFGNVTISEPGKLRLRFEVTGKREQSKGYTMAFCNIILGVPASGYVLFDSNGGSKVTGQGIAIGKDQLVKQPESPTRAGYTLEGWYADQALTQKWDFAADTVNDNKTLYAKWTPVAPDAYTVSFRTNYGDGGSGVGSQHIAADGNRLVFRPADPKREGYIFTGWYTSDTYEKAWDFETDTVSGDTILYAKWLVETPEQAALKKAIADAQAKLNDGCVYTKETLAVLQDKLAAAKAIGIDADTAAVIKATEELNAAINGLQIKQVESATVPLVTQEQTSSIGHYMSVTNLLESPVDLTPYEGGKLFIRFKLRINKDASTFPGSITAPSEEWIKAVRNGSLILWGGSAADENKVDIGRLDSQYKLSCGEAGNPLENVAVGEYLEVSIPVPQSVMEKGSLAKLEIYMYNDLHSISGNADDQKVGVTISVKDTLLVVEGNVPPVLDKAALKTLLDSEKNDAQLSGYTAESVKAYKALFTAGWAVYNDPDAADEDIAGAIDDLKNADRVLVNKPVDITALNDLIDEAQQKAVSGFYTEESVEALNAAIIAALEVAEDTNATQAAVDAQITALQAAIDALNPLIVWGDVDGKDGVTAADALLALQAATNKITLTDRQVLAANVDGEGGVTANDALLILQRATKKITSFPVEAAG